MVVHSPDNVELKITKDEVGEPVASEMVSVDSMGYGDYEFAFEGNFGNFDNSAVFGLFTFNWLDNKHPGYQEIDAIEISYWGTPKLTGKATYYPHEEHPVTNPDYLWPKDLKKGIVRLNGLKDALIGPTSTAKPKKWFTPRAKRRTFLFPASSRCTSTCGTIAAVIGNTPKKNPFA